MKSNKDGETIIVTYCRINLNWTDSCGKGPENTNGSLLQPERCFFSFFIIESTLFCVKGEMIHDFNFTEKKNKRSEHFLPFCGSKMHFFMPAPLFLCVIFIFDVFYLESNSQTNKQTNKKVFWTTKMQILNFWQWQICYCGQHPGSVNEKKPVL